VVVPARRVVDEDRFSFKHLLEVGVGVVLYVPCRLDGLIHGYAVRRHQAELDPDGVRPGRGIAVQHGAELRRRRERELYIHIAVTARPPP